MEQEKKIRTTIGVKTRNKKSKEQNENKKKKLGEIWTTYRWINSDDKLDENNKRWEQDLEKYHKLEQDRIEKSNNKTRRDKVETIQQDIASGTENVHESPIQILNPVPIIIPAKIPDSPIHPPPISPLHQP